MDKRMEAVLRKRASLLAGCPPVPEISVEEAASLPIHVTTWGSRGPKILIIHGGVQGGLGGGPSNFAGTQALAEQGWTLRLVDRPGFGKSPSRGADDMEADSVWIAEKLEEGSHLIGHSFGGAEALLAAARRPDAVRSLVLIEPALHMLFATAPEADENPILHSGLARMNELLMASQSPAEYAIRFVEGLARDNQSKVSANALAASLRNNAGQALKLGCSLLRAKAITPQTARNAVEKVASARIPVLLITGGWDEFHDEAGATIARMLKGHHVIVPSPSHFIPVANPQGFTAAVAAFLHAVECRQSPAPRDEQHQ